MQTAHTEPPARARVKLGLARVYNEIDETNGRSVLTNTTPEPGLRLGVTDFMDVGIAPWMTTGAAIDAKLNLLDNAGHAALAPRVSLGYGLGSDHNMLGVELGVIGSYQFYDWLEPYAGVGFANHWISGENADHWIELAPNQVFATRRGYGDGLVKTAIGVNLRIASGLHGLVEYDHWFLAQDDPGDGYAFLASDIVALSLAYDGF